MFDIEFRTKKSTRAYVYLPSRVELRGTKDSHHWNIIMYKNGKVDSVWGSTLPKIRIIWENTSNKSCSELNSIQKKSVGVYVYLLPPPHTRVELGALYRFQCSATFSFCTLSEKFLRHRTKLNFLLYLNYYN